MSSPRRSLRISQKKCVKDKATTICDLSNNAEKEFYQRRKTQKKGRDSASIKNDGIDYNGSDPLISELFDTDLLPTEIKTKSSVEKLKRSYIYIISKKIDGRTFLKIGVSNTTSLRLGSLQTALVPGLKNIGFRLHYLFFYKHESSDGSSTFAENIEQHLHKLLRNHDSYKNMVIHFPTNKPSEWYLPDEYRDFIEFILSFISVQTPAPEEGYHFFVKNNKNTREFKTEFLREVTRQEVLQYRRDHIKVKEGIMIERKLTQEQNLFKKGSKAYFVKKLIGSPIDVLGGDYIVGDIYYHKGKTDSVRLHGNYYAKISRKVSKTKKHKNDSDIESFIQLSYSEKVGDETNYWTHIFNLLGKMKEIGTLEPAGLLSNFNHYFSQPIVDAKRLVSSFSNTDVTLKQSQVEWIIGRHVTDKNDRVYVANSLSKVTSSGYIDKVIFAPVDSKTMLREADGKEISSNVIVAMTLAIEHYENKAPSYDIDEDYDKLGETKTKYRMYDFVKFDENYFKDFETNEPIQDEFIGIIMQNYDKFDKETEQYKNYYDVLFEDEMWRLESDSVEQNSKEFSNPVKKKKFVARLKNERKLISKVMKELGLKTKLTRIQTRSITRKSKPKPKSKVKATATRKSPRKSKSTMILRSNKT